MAHLREIFLFLESLSKPERLALCINIDWAKPIVEYFLKVGIRPCKEKYCWSMYMSRTGARAFSPVYVGGAMCYRSGWKSSCIGPTCNMA
jgi:hypothetical protein